MKHLIRSKVLFKAYSPATAKYDGKIATVEASTEAGYEISFANYDVLEGVDGSQLTPVGFTAQERINSTLKAWSQLR